MLHLSSSHEQDTSDLESQALHQCRRQHHRQGLGHEMKGCCGARSERTQVVVLRHFSHWPCRNFLWGPQDFRMVGSMMELAEVRRAELDKKVERNEGAGGKSVYKPSRASGLTTPTPCRTQQAWSRGR
jgi:hypothetical protein